MMMLLSLVFALGAAAAPVAASAAPPAAARPAQTPPAQAPPAKAPSAASAPPVAPAAAVAEQLPSVTLPPELQRVLTEYAAAWTEGDAATLARLFCVDGFVLAWGGTPVRGRGAIERHYQGQGGPLTLRALAYATSGDVGYIIGGYGHAAGAPDTGKFTLTLRKGEGGRWLIMSDMDSPNRRPS
jgi:ketosteroid isomerase-like protein